jgi:hypothetical protein
VWTLDGGVTAVATTPAAAEQASVFLGYRRRELWEQARFELSGSVTSGSLLQSASVNIGAGTALLGDAADVAVYYRPSATRYRADAAAFLEHSLGTRVWWAVRHDLDLHLSADVVTSPSIDLLFLYSGLAWRPRF